MNNGNRSRKLGRRDRSINDLVGAVNSGDECSQNRRCSAVQSMGKRKEKAGKFRHGAWTLGHKAEMEASEGGKVTDGYRDFETDGGAPSKGRSCGENKGKEAEASLGERLASVPKQCGGFGEGEEAD